MAYDELLAERVRKALAPRSGIVEKKLMGGLCWMWKGNMLCTVGVDRYLFRVGPDQEAKALGLLGAAPMEMAGRRMRGYVRVQAENAKGRALQKWIDMASSYVGSLPPK